MKPSSNLSIKKGAVVPWAKSNPPSPYYMQVLGSLSREFGFSLETPWKDLPEAVHSLILYGSKGKPVTLISDLTTSRQFRRLPPRPAFRVLPSFNRS